MADRLFGQDNDALLTPGKRLDIPGRIKKRSDDSTPKGSEVRRNLNERLTDSKIVNPANENINTGTFVGAVGTFIVWLFEDYLPGQVAADADVVGVEVEEDVIRYTVDTNAAIESQARFRAILDSAGGVTALWTDNIEVVDFEVVKPRTARDIYRYEITVER